MPRDLEKYRAKRTADSTPEPAGVVSPELGGLFVVHQHAARNLHWDLRLELDGVLLSFAVPKGPSPDPADKRLAVQTEDHPIEYADFEGVIPASNYGAGSMIVWEREVDPARGHAGGTGEGKLLFELKGYKLRGMWTLVKLKKGEKEWLLIRSATDTSKGRHVPAGVGAVGARWSACATARKW
jgi:bifunctional non-homologous end joining protein LigD